MVIPTGKATELFGGTVRLFPDPTFISIAFPVSARTSVYDAVWAFAVIESTYAFVAKFADADGAMPEAAPVKLATEALTVPVNVGDAKGAYIVDADVEVKYD